MEIHSSHSGCKWKISDQKWFMDDIRSQLRDRLATYDAELGKLEARLQRLSDLRRLTAELLEAEDKMWAEAEAKSARRTFAFDQGQLTPSANSLQDVVLSLLGPTVPTPQDQVAREAEQRYDFAGKSAKRSVNAVLLSLQHSGCVKRAGPKLWILAPPSQRGSDNQGNSERSREANHARQ